MTLDRFLTHLPRARRHGQQWQARCPAHDDRQASLSIANGDKGGVVLKCHAGCETAAILSALGLGLSDIMPERDERPAAPRPRRRIVAAYDYRDEAGELLFQGVRYEPKGFTQRRPDGRGGWHYNLDGARRVLYRLPELLAADPATTVFIPEGEKDVERLRALGLVATCNPQGAGKWREEYGTALRARAVVILPDNDDPGGTHAEQVAALLHGVAASVKVLRLPSLPKKGDVSDWLDAGGTAERLRELAAACPEWQPTAREKAESKPEAGPPPLSVRRLADVEPEEVGWLWRPYIPLAKLTLLEGDPGIGKSWLTCAMATAVAQGFGLPGMERREAANVLMLSAEDGLGDTIRPRLDAMRADVSRVFAIDEPVAFDERGLLAVEEAVAVYAPALVIVDPLVAYIGGGVDIHRANETRAVMAALAQVAARQRCAILCVRHLNKSGNTKAMYRGQGSIDFNAAVRSGLLAGVDPDDESKRAIIHFKSNLAPKGAAVGYTLRPGEGLLWTGESSLTAERILGGLATSEEESAGRREATDFLRDALQAGERPARELRTEATQAGISVHVLRRARESLGIKPRREGFGKSAVYYWALPIDGSEPAIGGKDTDACHLWVNGSGKDACSNGLPIDGSQSVLATYVPPMVPTMGAGGNGSAEWEEGEV